MAAQIIDGTALAAKVREEVKQRVARLESGGKAVHLVAVLIGGDPAAEMYAQRQEQTCQAVGISYELVKLPAEASSQEVEATIERLNHDPSVTGIMLHLPVPKHLDSAALQFRISPQKDVEGVNPANLGYLISSTPVNIPCTAAAAFELVKSTGATIRGAEAVVIGASEIVGKPVAMLLSDERATVTMCRSATRDLAAHTRRAEILVVAVGRPEMITGDHVGEGAVVVDVGINRIIRPDGTRKTVGDVLFDEAKEKAGFITPVPGGVGPMTVAMLLRNTVRSAEAQLARR